MSFTVNITNGQTFNIDLTQRQGLNGPNSVSSQTLSFLGNGVVVSDSGLFRVATNSEIITESELTSALSSYAPLSGGTFSGAINTNSVINFLGPTVGQNSWYRIRSEDNASTGRLIIESINNAGNMTLDRTGNLTISSSCGIGTSPVSAINLTLGGSSARLRFLTEGGSGTWTQIRSSFNVTNPDILFENSVNGVLARIRNDGNFAVGGTSPTARFHVQGINAAVVQSIIQGAASQTANLTEWQNSAGTVLASVGATGNVTATNLRVNNGNSTANTSGLTLFNANGTNGRVGQWLMGWPGNFDNSLIGMQNGTAFVYIDDTAVNFNRTVSFVGSERDISHANNGGNLVRFSTVDNSTRVSGANLVRLQIGALDRLVVQNDFQVRFGDQGTNAPSFFTFTGSSTTSPASGRGLTLFGRNNVVGGVHFGIGGDSFVSTSGLNTLCTVQNTFAPSSGTASYIALHLTPTVNQTGGANGITRGIAIEPTLTSAADWRSYDTNVNTGFAYNSSGTAPSRFAGNVMIGSSSITPVVRLQIRGAGTTSGTTSLIIEDSGGSNWLSARDDRMFNITGTQSFNNGANISPSAGGDSLSSGQLCGLRFRSAFTLSDINSEFFFRNSLGSRSFTSSFGSLMEFSGGFAPTSGTGTYAIARLTGTINQTGGANGITQGVLVAPTLTSAADWRSFDTNVNSGFAYHSSGTAPSRFGGNVGIGTIPTARLQVEASDNSTQGIFVRNLNDGTSASTDLTLSNFAGQTVSLRNHSSTHSVWANTSLLSSAQSGGLVLNTSTTSPVRIFVNNTERASFSTTTFTLNLPGVLPVFTVAGLPAANTMARARCWVSDSNVVFNSTNLGNVVAGGGVNLVPVYSDGTNWRIG